MGIQERKQLEKDAFRNKILDAASEIIIRDGYENLSIRKIASLIEYSPTVIYNYFEDKSKIIECLVQKGTDEIIGALDQTSLNDDNYIEVLQSGLNSYINIMLKNAQLFKALIMNNIEASKSGMLYKGVAKEKKTIALVRQIIDIGIKDGKFREEDSELQAQIVWSSTFGLLSRIIMENRADEELRKSLIRCHIDFIINGLLRK